MKIFCIGKNYLKHALEMNSSAPSEPVVFMKPMSALLIDNKPFYYPEFSKNIHYEGEIVLKISKNGKYVQPEFAASYIESIGFGIDFTARDLQDNCKKNGWPWEIAKGFDQSAAVSKWIPIPDDYEQGISFGLYKNDKLLQNGNTKNMIFSFTEIICYLSKFFKIQTGDMIFTGTPEGVGPVKPGDVLKGFIGEQNMLRCEIK